MPGLSSFNYQHAAALKAAISLAAAALLAWWWYVDRRDKDPRTSRRDGSLAILGVPGFVAWWNFGSILLPGRTVHYWEFFHYYLGSKYLIGARLHAAVRLRCSGGDRAGASR